MQVESGAGGDAPGDVAGTATERGKRSLSVKLLVLTVVFVMASGIATFVPSIASFRTRFLEDRLQAAEAASLLLDSDVWTEVPRAVQDNLLATVGATAIVLRTGQVSRLLAAVEMPPLVDEVVDLRQTDFAGSIRDAFKTLFAWSPRTLRVIGETVGGKSLELVVSDRPLRRAMLHFAWSILAVSAIISLLTALLVYLTLVRLFVQPMQRMSQAMADFAADPEDGSRVIRPSGRHDEIGIAEDRLAAMQRQLVETLSQKRHLADLGLAVSKINHDLRNLLASAQLFSDRIGALPDPAVQRFAPKLIAALDRAIDYCQTTLAYGRAREPEPNRRLVLLERLVRDVAEVLGVDQGPVRFECRVDAGLEVDADPDQLFRVLLNLCRNALQAMDGSPDDAVVRRLTIDAARQGAVVTIRIRDTGPGVPEKARAHLFQAFQGSARPGGTGLGLAIASEIIRAHGGTISLVERDGPGAIFEIAFPDRPASFERAVRARTARHESA